MLKPVRLSRLTQSQPVVDAQGRPASAFLTYFNKALQQIEAAFNGIITAQNAAEAAQASADDAADDAASASSQASSAQSTANSAQTAASGAQTTASNALSVANSKLSQTTADGRYVRQDQTASWAASTGTEDRSVYAAYVSPTISATPTQAEVQAISDALEGLSQHMVALINDLRGNDVLTS